MLKLFLSLFLVLNCFAFSAEITTAITGKVVKVTDGDTLTLLIDKTQVKVRLSGIDAPESSQAFGKKSKEALVLCHL